MALIHDIETIVNETLEGWSFVFETQKMMNELADDKPFPCVFFEEYTDGKLTNRYGWKEHTLVELSFMKLAAFQGDATEREAIREDMKQNAVFPFIKALQSKKIVEEIKDFTLLPEPPRFDSNCVSLLLRFTAIRKVCI